MEVSGAKRKVNTSISSDHTVKNQPCAQCEELGQVTLASGFCRTCNDFLCSPCIEQHKKIRATKNHELLEGEDMPGQKPTPTFVEYCTVHPNRAVEMYCLDENILGCTLCFFEGHKTCRNAGMISKLSKDIETSQEMTDIREACVKQKTLSIQFRELIQKLQSANNECHSKCLEDYHIFQTEIIDLLGKGKDIVSKRADTLKQENNEKLQKLMDMVLSSEQQIESSMNNIDARLPVQENQNDQLFIAVKKNSNQIFDSVQILEQLLPETYIQEFNFTYNSSIHDMLDKCCKVKLETTQELASECLGSSETDTKSSQNTPTPAASKSDYSDEKSRKVSPATVCETRSLVNIKSYLDIHNCSVVSILEISPSQLVLTDASNSCLKLIDMERNKIIKRQPVDPEPQDITMLSDFRLAVSFPDCSEIRIFMADKNLDMLKKLSVKGECYGLCCIGDKLVVSYGKQAKLEIIDFNGRVMQSIKRDSSRHALFKGPEYIAVNVEKSLIYVSDFNKHTLTCIDKSLAIRWVYWDDDLRGPTGVSTGNDGCLYVCSKHKHTIHVVSSDGRKLAVLPVSDTGVNFGLAVCYSNFSKKLFVSSLKYDSDTRNCITKLTLR